MLSGKSGFLIWALLYCWRESRMWSLAVLCCNQSVPDTEAKMVSWLIYYIQFQILLEAVEQSGENIFQEVPVAMCNLLYRSCRVTPLSSSEHDFLSWYFMRQFVEVIHARMEGRVGGTCSALHWSSKRLWTDCGEEGDVLIGNRCCHYVCLLLRFILFRLYFHQIINVHLEFI